MSTHTAPISVIDGKMSDDERCLVLVPQVVELSKNELSRLNVAMDTVFKHRYKDRFDYFLKRMVKAKAKEQILKERALIQPTISKLEPILPAPTKVRPGSQLLLFV